MSVIATQQLSKCYGLRRGVDDVDLRVGAGEIFGFLGPNGAGKSTTIRLLLGFLKASSGNATVFGQDCWSDSATIKQEVGYVAGDVRLYPWLTARKALQIVGEIRGRDILSDGLQLADRFRMEPDLPVRRMSRGNRQKVALMMALAHRPKLVVLDEPTSGLDPLMQDTLADCLRELAAAGHTVFFSSHTLSEVESLCDRIAIVRDGQIVVNEQLSRLKARAPRTAVVTFESATVANSVTVPDFITIQSRSNKELQIQITGAAVELTHWAAAQPIIDLSVGPPNLEHLFRQYYKGNAARPVHNAAAGGSAKDAADMEEYVPFPELENS
ncbi:MAG: ABC transporter ATP-binding protein [Fuerstiella sp.]|jgi:ABC-2 type transport system ATP-binding protein|nr:ABC transporter ATP-binding protein [Fuerstiella sp.]MCP4509980.1 ABC transporter ATP-binding protein [Fuerstiella sp.]